MRYLLPFLLAGFVLIGACQSSPNQSSMADILAQSEHISGREAYLNSPYVTAGDRVYMVGHQDGSFPDLGWHVKGEMGGIWDHPIKLMDGFSAAMLMGEQTYCLNQADSFVNYPFANRHYFSTPAGNVAVERLQFVPDATEAVVVQYRFQNRQKDPQSFAFTFNGMSDLRPVWLGERTNMIDGADSWRWDEATQTLIAKDSLNPWYVIVGTERSATSHKLNDTSCEFTRRGLGRNASLTYQIDLAPHASEELTFIIAGSYQSQDAAQQTYRDLVSSCGERLVSKQKRYEQIAQTAQLSIPDKDLEQAYRWLKYNTDWLIRDVPEVGRGIGAGIPDYPWWFGVDSEYALRAIMAVGKREIVYETIDLLDKLSRQTNQNGRIVHEVSTNGAVFNPGNINETPQFATLIWEVYRWNGDKAFLQKYFPTVQQGLEWLVRETDKDGNLLPDGFGIMEIHGLDSEMIDVAAYSQKAFADAAKIAAALGKTDLAQGYADKAAQLKEIINTEFWVDDAGSFADFIGTTEQALHLIEDAIVRADTLDKPWAVKELKATRARISRLPLQQKQGFVLHHNWVVNTPMEIGIVDTARALRALETGSQFVNPYGLFVTGIDRDETAGKDESSFAAGKKVFSYTGAVMTLPTGVMAVAENQYGRPDRALDYLQRLGRSFSFALPGSIYEVSPDFGMMTQAWNLYGFAIPIVQQFFGIQPSAAQRKTRIQPLMPEEWANAKLENVLVGDNNLTITYQKEGDQSLLHIQQSQADWTLEIAFPIGKFSQWQVNGESSLPLEENGFEVMQLEGQDLQIVLSTE
ncbi:MAG: glycogen debranching protein [Bacteroidota bacterium]